MKANNGLNKKLQFNVSLDEANLILKALGKLPFEEVYDIIGKLNAQANQQLKDNGENKLMGLLNS